MDVLNTKSVPKINKNSYPKTGNAYLSLKNEDYI